MESDQEYSLTTVIRHVKHFLQKMQPNSHITLEYKFAKPAQSIEGNKKFQKILESSFEEFIVMNTDREKNNYVRLKSMTFQDQFQRFQDNLQTLQTFHDFRVQKKQKVNLTVIREKIMFDCESMIWAYVNRRHLFAPCYEVARNGQLFRIGLHRQYETKSTHNKKISELITKTKNRAIKKEKQQPYDQKLQKGKKQQHKKLETIQSKQQQNAPYLKDHRDQRQSPFRFKIQETYHLSKCCFLVMSKVCQVIDVELYQEMCVLVKFGSDFSASIANKCKTIFSKMKDQIAYEVEFRFNPNFVKEFDDLEEEEIEKIMKSGAQILLSLAKDPVQFSADQIVTHLDIIDGK